MTVAKPVLRHMDVLSYMLGRWLLVTPLALAFGAITGTLEFSGLFAIGMAACAGFIDSTLGGLTYLLAMQRTSAYQTSTLSSTAPVWGVASAILILGEPSRWQVFVAAGLAVLGAFFVAGHRLRIREHSIGSMYGLVTGLLWGIAETIPAKLALDAGMSPAALLFVFAGSGVVTIALLLPILRGRFPVRITRRGAELTALAGVGGAFCGWLLWLSALGLAPASVISPVRGSTLIFALLYAMLFLRERPGRWALLGATLIAGGVVLVSTVA